MSAILACPRAPRQGSGAARAAKPSRLVKVLPLSFVQKIKLLLARLWAKLKTWRLRRRTRTVVHR